MAQNLLDTVDFSTGYTAGHTLATDDSAHWTDIAATFNPCLVSTPKGGVASFVNAGSANVRTGFTWTNDQWVQGKLVIVPSGYSMIGVRFLTSVATGYCAGPAPESFNRYRIFRFDAGAITSLIFSTRDPTAGDFMNLQIVGSSLTLLIYDSSMVLQETVGPVTDATYASGDGPVVITKHTDNTSSLFSTWTAGSVGAAPTLTAPMFRGS